MKTTILLNNLEPNCLHDCIISSINLSDKKLEIVICKEGIPADLQQEKNANKLVVSFIINENFMDETFIPAVRRINYNFGRRAIKYYTLKQFIERVSKKGVELQIYTLYYNSNGCFLWLLDETRKDRGDYEIELLVDEIIYEWE